MRQIGITIMLSCFCFAFGLSDDNKTILQINMTIGNKPIKEKSELKFYLINENIIKGLASSNDNINIDFYNDSAQVMIQYKELQLTTPYFSFSDLQNLSRLDVNIVTKRQKMRNKHYKNYVLVYTISEKPKGHGIGRFTRIETKNL